ncbi:YkoF family thiamine/hydroxymethylpyrimidine-binding protein [Lentibacillus salinarum]|uniref:YkoF family thiamine/hydroxymethylpyrimidine-binding protein n=1 Tax=Lentibacillus salinarum TaxID=446820 RepID=A0ABW3ZSR7_9BACI
MQNNSCGTSRIAGCQFTLLPMSDKFVDIIMGALDEVDTSNIWKKTDDVSTCVRGKMEHVFDVTQALFLHAANTGEHVAMSGTFSIGCPGDTEADAYMDGAETPLNEATSKQISQQAGCKFSLYPMGREDYMDTIYEQIDLSKHRNVEVSASHYATRLDGDVKAIFEALHQSFDSVQEKVSHVTMTFTISANSPSNKT